jgi:hypothetical protein
MTDPTAPLPAQTFAQSFALNASNQLKSGSTWAAGAFLIVLGAFAAWPGAAAALDAIPFLKGYGIPIIGMLTVLVAKFRPSGTVSSQAQMYAAEIVRLVTNKQLAAHGVPEIPPPAGGVPLPKGMVVPEIPPVPQPAPAPAAPAPIAVPVAPVLPAWAAPAVAPPEPVPEPVPAPPLPEPIPPAPPAEMPTHIDVVLPPVLPPVELPIDGALLLSLFKQYIAQQAPRPKP